MEPASYNQENPVFKDRWVNYIHSLQKEICSGLENLDGKSHFVSDSWQREEGKGGGGISCTLSEGNVFEKAGVNTSVVYGSVTDTMRRQLEIEGDNWFACGLSLVLHPLNPYVPTVHANWRYFELTDQAGNITDQWFGGGTDLTPYYLFEEDVRHFHRTLQETLDPFGKELYPAYKKQCDDYFVNHHRNRETRGVGGIFYDHLRVSETNSLERLFAYQQANGNAFLPGYLPIVIKRKDTLYGEREKEWQEIRRGRYVEFNLLHDRGTLFGLKTNGRTESILMSLPPRARWVYNHRPPVGSEEEKLLQVCLQPVNWL
ncbi:MAG: oxygen-dependent coproporphyrinogen oxidase [Bacteroidota bacterium]|nr:oxygen-dependent coproporphyrinogen oxidase [Bacteroidota bacterium]